LREGNSDRRCASPVKRHAQSIKKRSPAMIAWKPDNRSRVATMTGGDFFASEQSHVMQKAGTVKITLR
jgi:isocitrate dehydrogenase